VERRPCYKSEHGRKSKFNMDNMAAKYLMEVLDSSVPQQPTCLSSDGRPRYKPLPNSERKLEVDDSIFELGFDLDLDCEDSTEMDQQNGEAAQHHAPFDSGFCF